MNLKRNKVSINTRVNHKRKRAVSCLATVLLWILSGNAAFAMRDVVTDDPWNGNWGFIDGHGRWVIKPRYNAPAAFHNGIARVACGSPWQRSYQYINAAGKVITNQVFDSASPVSDGCGVGHVSADSSRQQGGFYAISADGHKVKLPQSNIDIDKCGRGFIPYTKNGKIGIANCAGRIIIEPTFDEVGRPSQGLVSGRIGDKWSVINKTGQVVISSRIESEIAPVFSDGLAVIKNHGKFGYLNSKGSVVVEPAYENAEPFQEKLAQVTRNGHIGFIDTSGRLIIRNKYDYAGDFSEGLAPVGIGKVVQSDSNSGNNGDGSNWGYVDTRGRMAIPLQFYFAGEFQEGLAPVAIKRGRTIQYGFINRKGNFTIAPRYAQAESFSEGLASALSTGNKNRTVKTDSSKQ